MYDKHSSGSSGLATLDHAFQRVAAGDTNAFRDVVFATLTDLYRFATRLLTDLNQAEELLPKAYTDWIAGGPSLSRGSEARLALFQNVFQRAMEILHTRERDHALLPEPARTPGLPTPPLQTALTDLGHWMEALAPLDRAVWVLTVLEGHSAVEVARVVGAPPAQVEEAAVRARGTLEQRVGLELPAKIETWRKSTTAMAPPAGLKARINLSRLAARSGATPSPFPVTGTRITEETVAAAIAPQEGLLEVPPAPPELPAAQVKPRSAVVRVDSRRNVLLLDVSAIVKGLGALGFVAGVVGLVFYGLQRAPTPKGSSERVAQNSGLPASQLPRPRVAVAPISVPAGVAALGPTQDEGAEQGFGVTDLGNLAAAPGRTPTADSAPVAPKAVPEASARGGSANAGIELPDSSQVPESLTSDAVMQTVEQHRAELEHCARWQGRRQPSVHGTLVMQWTVLPSGRVSDVANASPGLEGTYLESCIRKLAPRWKFPEHRLQGEPVKFPFRF